MAGLILGFGGLKYVLPIAIFFILSTLLTKIGPKNLHKSKKPSKKLIEKCLIYLFIKDVLLRNRCYLIHEYIPSRKLDENFFWKKASKNLKKFSFEKDEFYRMLIKQLELKLRHTINFKRIKKTKKIFNDFNEIR